MKLLITFPDESMSLTTTDITVPTCVVTGGTVNMSVPGVTPARATGAVNSTPAVATVTDKLPSKNRVVDRIIASSSATSVPSKRASRVLQGYEIKLAPPG